MIRASSSTDLIRVLHVCQRDDPDSGGAVQIARTLVKYLAELEYIEPDLAFLYGEPGFVHQQLPDRCIYLNVQNKRELIGKSLELRKILKNYDIVHHHDMTTWSNIVSLTLPNLRRVMHGHILGGVRSFGLRSHFSNWIQTRKLRKFIAISDEVGSSWNISDKSILKTVYNGIEFSCYRSLRKLRTRTRKELGIPEDSKVIGFVGRLHNTVKGVDEFVETLNLLPANYVGVIVGDGQDRNQLEQLVQSKRIGERVLFTGGVCDPQKYYSVFDAFLFTSHFEGFGLTPLEAIASLTPVYCFSCKGGFREWANENLVFQLPNRDTEEMAKLIESTLSSNIATEKAHQASELAATQFDAPSFAKQIADTYREIMY